MKGFTVVLAAAVGSACMTGPRRVADPGFYLQGNSPERIWTVLADGEEMVIEGPRVIADTVFGWSEGDEVSIPVKDIKELRARKLSVVRTAALPVILAGGTTFAIVTFRSDSTHDADRDSTLDLRSLPRP